jgi:hypothetical protein
MAEPVKVAATALVVAYSQAEMLRLMVEGVPRAEASDVSWELFRSIVAYNGYRSGPPDRTVRVPTRCLALSSGGTHEVLGMDWDAFVRKNGTGPSSLIDAKPLAQLRWLVGAVRRIADGVNELDAATQAKADAEGKPRKKRKRIDRDVLLAIIDEAQDATWEALHAGWLANAPAKRPTVAIEYELEGDAAMGFFDAWLSGHVKAWH